MTVKRQRDFKIILITQKKSNARKCSKIFIYVVKDIVAYAFSFILFF